MAGVPWNTATGAGWQSVQTESVAQRGRHLVDRCQRWTKQEDRGQTLQVQKCAINSAKMPHAPKGHLERTHHPMHSMIPFIGIVSFLFLVSARLLLYGTVGRQLPLPPQLRTAACTAAEPPARGACPDEMVRLQPPLFFSVLS